MDVLVLCAEGQSSHQDVCYEAHGGNVEIRSVHINAWSHRSVLLLTMQIFSMQKAKLALITGVCLRHSLSVMKHYPAVSGAFMDSPYNGNTSLQTSTSNLNAGYSRPSEAEDDGKVSSDTIWLWIAVLATIGNIVVVAVVCACAF
ncbi:hypothetical protein FQN60_005046 [Etheostoma spectabile]|uniref:Uncharacterized protein n=3 Tax=Percomorphaceae TaxID=1489872 RepID=A0A5J5DLP8_9PERO|nr:hypothetical protein FQN60_005046 [Etheostoma spectabile]